MAFNENGTTHKNNGMTLEDLVKITRAKAVFTGKDFSKVIVAGLADDSRFIQKGEAFFCLKGGKKNGEDFAAEAAKKGASAIVAEVNFPVLFDDRGTEVPVLIVENARAAMSLASCFFYGNPAREVKAVGITGTNGKTTVTYLLSSIFAAAEKNTGLIGTTGIVYAEKKIDPLLTTPDPAFLQKTLADMRDRSVEYVFLEVSAHAIYHKKIAGMPFRARIFTNCTRDHLDFFQTEERYSQTKKEFFAAGERGDEEIFVINVDDDIGREIAREAKERGIKTFTYGLDNPADAFAVVTEETTAGTKFLLNVFDRLCRVDLPLVGKHNVYNALAAATTAFALRVPLKSVEAGLNAAIAPRGRLQSVKKAFGSEIFVDFAHTPDGLEKSLDALRPFCKGKLYCVFGCGGDRDKGKRPKMGEIAAKKADFCFLTSDNPRYEDAYDIIREIEQGYCRVSDAYACVPDRKKAVFLAVEKLTKGDILLIAGKGGEEYQEIMGIKYEYDDESAVEEAVAARRG